jgi:hypothetical protein
MEESVSSSTVLTFTVKDIWSGFNAYLDNVMPFLPEYVEYSRSDLVMLLTEVIRRVIVNRNYYINQDLADVKAATLQDLEDQFYPRRPSGPPNLPEDEDYWERKDDPEGF